MRTVDLIQRKRDGEELAPEEIEFLVEGYTSGDIPDYQMSAFLMAVYFSGMSDREVSRLTECMLRSGETVDLSSVPGVASPTIIVLFHARGHPSERGPHGSNYSTEYLSQRTTGAPRRRRPSWRG